MAGFMDDRAILKCAFESMDKDGDGFLDPFEIEQVFRKYYESKGKSIKYEQLKNKVLAFMRKVDVSGDGQISLDEFLAYFTNQD